MRDLHVLSCYLRLRSAIRAILRNVSAVYAASRCDFHPGKGCLDELGRRAGIDVFALMAERD
jgi:hypothetical protein